MSDSKLKQLTIIFAPLLANPLTSKEMDDVMLKHIGEYSDSHMKAEVRSAFNDIAIKVAQRCVLHFQKSGCKLEALPSMQILSEVQIEMEKAQSIWPPFNSAHEGYAVLLEEVDELWDHVKTNQKRRDLDAMRKEAIQVSAMAARFAQEVCCEIRGRK